MALTFSAPKVDADIASSSSLRDMSNSPLRLKTTQGAPAEPAISTSFTSQEQKLEKRKGSIDLTRGRECSQIAERIAKTINGLSTGFQGRRVRVAVWPDRSY